ncbi:hypothetical protein E4U41_007571 [Claviceps citrina]|nr:hypothetical protein E4U41_007571 [Claviceps citrina]
MVRLAFMSVLAPGPDPAGSKNVGNGQGKQFITGQCLSNADCASDCCAQQDGGVGLCSGVGAQFQAGKTGCGFVDQAGRGGQPDSGGSNGTGSDAGAANGQGGKKTGGKDVEKKAKQDAKAGKAVRKGKGAAGRGKACHAAGDAAKGSKFINDTDTSGDS